MKHEFIPHEEAYELRKLGFDEPSIATYGTLFNNEWGLIINSDYYKHHKYHESVKACTAPLYQQAFRWFRKKYRLEQMITFNHVTQEYAVMIMYRSSTKYDGIVSSDWISPIRNYEEAELACLRKLIEIIK